MMFTQSEIGAKCECDCLEVVMKEHDFKRYLVPAGYYGERYQSARYYAALWWTLRCEQCDNVRDDFIVYRWRGRKGYTLVNGPFADDRDFQRYREIYQVIKEAMAA